MKLVFENNLKLKLIKNFNNDKARYILCQKNVGNYYNAGRADNNKNHGQFDFIAKIAARAKKRPKKHGLFNKMALC